MRVKIIKTWKDFDSVVRNLDGWAFRGHRVADWQLFSSLSRYLMDFVPDEAVWQEREAKAIRIFRRKAHNFLHDSQVLRNDLRSLALMQHHGAPTRLLDFTKSPYVAAFFALERATGDAAVYAVNTPRLWLIAPKAYPDLGRDQIDPRKKTNFTKYFAKNKYEVIWFGEPDEMDRRLLAQSGTFILPGVLDRPVEKILPHYADDKALIKKFILPAAVRDEFMRFLYRMNITHATLFPDLDGLAKSIGFEMEIVWKGLLQEQDARLE